MTKKRADGSANSGKLEKAKDLLFEVRADLTEAFSEHDQRTAAILSAAQKVIQDLLTTFQEEAATTQEALQLLARKRDNIEARLKGRPIHHKGIKQTVKEVLALGRERTEHHVSALGQVTEDLDAEVDEIMEAGEVAGLQLVKDRQEEPDPEEFDEFDDEPHEASGDLGDLDEEDPEEVSS